MSFDPSCNVSEHTCCFIASQSARSVSDSEEGVSGMLKKGTWLPVGQEVEEPVDEIVGADSRRRSAFFRTKYCSKLSISAFQVCLLILSQNCVSLQ